MNIRTHQLIGALVITLLASNARGQSAPDWSSGGWSSGGTVSAVTTPSGAPGGFLGGSDDCSAAHTNLGSGDVFLVPFASGTTGSEGQSEAFCNSGGGVTGIDNDVWFDWTATQTGLATVTTCGGTNIDTKIAIWPDSSPAGCPADGTALACIDNRPACGFQAVVTWPVTAGSTYTIQLGNSPGAPAGVGTLDVTQGPAPPCGQYDDGVADGYGGLGMGGEFGWLHRQDCLGSVDRIETAYGAAGSPFPTPDGLPSRIVCYEDPDCDGDPRTPAGGMTLVWSLATVTVNGNSNILNSFPAPMGVNTLIPSGCSWVMATTEQTPSERPAPLDDNATTSSWVVAAFPTGSTLDISDLNNNSGTPLPTQVTPFPGAWLLRAHATDCATACQQCADSGGTDQAACDLCDNPPCNFVPAPVCFGDGGGGACGCGNDGAAGEGCANGTGSGAMIAGLGFPSLSNDSFEVITTQIPNSPGLTFQGDNLIPNAPTFGDGLRCCGMNLVRWVTVAAEGNCASTNQPSGCGTQVGGAGGPISQHPGNAGLQPGDSRCYQHWYRDPGGNNPCGIEFFNLSPAIVVTWQP